MSFVAAAPATDADLVIPNVPFFPDIKIGEARDAIRIDGTVTAPRFKSELLAAVFMVNHELAVWRTQKEAEGFAKLKDIPADEVGGEHRLEHLYRRAIHHALKAALLERYRDTDAARSANSKESELTEQIDEIRRDMRWALRDLTGQKRALAELL